MQNFYILPESRWDIFLAISVAFLRCFLYLLQCVGEALISGYSNMPSLWHFTKFFTIGLILYKN